MYRPSPVRNPRSKGIKSKNVLQVCLLLAVCFWLIFQVKRSHEKKKEFDNTKKEFDNTKISLTTTKQSIDEIPKFGRKDLQPKLEKEAEIHEEQDEEEHEEQDEEKIDEEKDDENEQEKSEVEVDQEEVIDEESQSQSQTENGDSVEDHEVEEEEEDGASIHTHEGREEHYKADDASSAVVTHLATETLNNVTNEETTIMNSNSTEDVNVIVEGFAPNQTEGSSNSSYVKSDELNSSNEVESEEGEGEGENLEGNDVILDPDEVENETHLEEKEVRMDLDTLPEIETEGGNSEETAAERR